MTPAIEVAGVGLRHGDGEVLRNLSLEVGEGAILGLRGPSGCG